MDRLAERVPTVPAATTLSKNAPNPTSGITHFEFKLPSGTPVRLTVYELLGRQVAQRHYGMLPAGTHTESVETGDWPAGTYPYRLTVGERHRTGTIQVVR